MHEIEREGKQKNKPGSKTDPAARLLSAYYSLLAALYNFGNLLSTIPSVGTRPLSPSFNSAGAMPASLRALW